MDSKTIQEAPASTKTAVKSVFNKGQRDYQHGDIVLKAGQFTQLPEEHANLLLDKFGHEIVAAEDVDQASRDRADEAAKLKAENAELKAKAEKLQAVIDSEPADSKAAASRKAAQLEQENEALKKQLAELQASKGKKKTSIKDSDSDSDDT